MGVGKSTIGRMVASQLGLPFRDTDAEIERASGCSVAEMFERQGEHAFRENEWEVTEHLLRTGPLVLATGGGAFMDTRTREAIRAQARSVWLRCPLAILVRRVGGHPHRPLLSAGNAGEILEELMRLRYPVYAEADIVIDQDDEGAEQVAETLMAALGAWREPRTVRVALAQNSYDIRIGSGLIARAGGLLAPVLPQKRAMIVTDETVAAHHLPVLREALREAGIDAESIVVPPGEGSKSLAGFGQVVNALLEAGVERRTAVIAFGGGVVGDLAGFAAASALRGLPFVQIPTTLLSQVDSSVGGKTGINTPFGKNLIGAFHQPLAVLVDTDMLATLPVRELSAGYAEIIKAGLIGDPDLFDWCLAHANGIICGDGAVQAEAIARACAFKAAVVGDDEREEKASDGRALLNLGHSFAHALEAEMGYDGRLLHGEAVAVGLGLALLLSARLGYCDASVAETVMSHLDQLGMASRVSSLSARLGVTFTTQSLLANMQRDKKIRDGRLAFVLVRGVGRAFTSRDVDPTVVAALLADEGCRPL